MTFVLTSLLVGCLGVTTPTPSVGSPIGWSDRSASGSMIPRILPVSWPIVREQPINHFMPSGGHAPLTASQHQPFVDSPIAGKRSFEFLHQLETAPQALPDVEATSHAAMFLFLRMTVTFAAVSCCVTGLLLLWRRW